MTAKETYTKVTGCIINHKDVEQAMIEFAKMHVQAALEVASENAETKEEYDNIYDPNDKYYVVDKNSILNSYPLTNIK